MLFDFTELCVDDVYPCGDALVQDEVLGLPPLFSFVVLLFVLMADAVLTLAIDVCDFTVQQSPTGQLNLRDGADFSLQHTIVYNTEPLWFTH